MNLILAIVGLALFAVTLSASAQTSPPQSGGSATQPTASPTVEGEVRKVDKDQGKITLKHGPITNLEMPGMTMVFRVKDPAMLDKVKAGDKIRFTADKVEGNITVTTIEAVR